MQLGPRGEGNLPFLQKFSLKSAVSMHPNNLI